MSREMPVVAAIPNYNMAESLAKLLPQVLEQGYDDVYILDDASTDHTREAVTPFGSGIRFIAGQENLGPGGNRNRMLAALGYEAIIHFIDADVQLVSEHNPDHIRTSFKQHPEAGVIGGLIRLSDGTPWMFNYGPRYSAYSNLAGWAQVMAHDPDRHSSTKTVIDKISGWRHNGFPDLSKQPAPRQVFWVGEANFCIPSEIYKEVGGFDPELRYHEAQDLGYKLHEKGYESWFDPEFSVEHPEIRIGDPQHIAMQREADKQIIQKYGLPLK